MYVDKIIIFLFYWNLTFMQAKPFCYGRPAYGIVVYTVWPRGNSLFAMAMANFDSYTDDTPQPIT